MNFNACINNNQQECLGREKIPLNGKFFCCQEQIEDEKQIVLNIVDNIEAEIETIDSILKICSKISYATSVIYKDANYNLDVIFSELKRFSLTIHQFKDKVVNDTALFELVSSFLSVVKNWFTTMFLNIGSCSISDNYEASLKSDLLTIEMALGVCVLSYDDDDEDFDDMFF